MLITDHALFYDAGAVRAPPVCEIHPLAAPFAAGGRAAGRWRPQLPAALNTPLPRSLEALRPVTEVVVHFRDWAPRRFQLHFGQEMAILHVQVRQSMNLPRHSVLRIPAHCPAEVGYPLHVYLHVPDMYDPWIDPPAVPEHFWAVVSCGLATVCYAPGLRHVGGTTCP